MKLTIEEIDNLKRGDVCPICHSKIECRESEMPLSFPESMRRHPNIFFGCKCYEGSSKDEWSARRFYIEGMKSMVNANKEQN